ncbi:MAG: tRNA (adenosine(37)-N6)-threonylcarbamoyltransferase complex ATPase subunit type 1 TsaE [Lachnospiraceae bacterium]|nr:tRNA (adenosine(37)-N6)-threonylcarbamoyltransferase complex ATPase subunit type 1 TsaE [Lachnospiraceae bacterium]
MIKESFCSEDTFEFGRKLGEAAEPGEVYALTGDLGTGKTVFAQGFAAGLGIAEPVNSPTFTILKIYEQGRLPLYHFDVYRIEDPDEMYEVGYEEYFGGDGVALVEWAELMDELMPDDAIKISITKDPGRGDDYRLISCDKE